MRDNPELKLPAAPIIVAHRADSSGTTAIFTEYLSKVSPEWKSGPGAGRTVQWPTGAAARGNEGVAGLVSRGEGWVGYIELGYAIHARLGIALLQNRQGAFVAPSAATISAALAGIEIPEDFRTTSLIDAPGDAAWPITGMTWALIYSEQHEVKRAKALVDPLWWCTHDGQDLASQVGFAPLPSGLVVRVERALRTIRADGNPLLGDP